MPFETRSSIFLHLVWATWDRLPMLVPPVVEQVYRVVGAECAAAGGEVIALGGVEDHIHLLVRLPPTVAAAELMQRVKGVSAHLVTHDTGEQAHFKWQRGYGVASVSPSHVPQVTRYIARQREHHAEGELHPALELGGDGD